MICPVCQAQLEQGTAFCTRCKLPQPASGVAIAPTHPVLTLVTPTPQPPSPALVELVPPALATELAAPLHPYAQPPYAQPPYAQPPQSSGLATAGIVLGCLGVLSPAISLTGLVLALIARHQRQPRSKVAVVISATGFVLSVLIAIAVFALLGSPLGEV